MVADDLALDHDTLDAQLVEAPAPAAEPDDPWLARRRLTVGASEIAVAMVIAGMLPMDALASYDQQKARPTRVGYGGRWVTAPRLVLVKAGMIDAPKAGDAARIGTLRERELLAAWLRALERGSLYCDAEALLDVATVRHADEMPREWLPLRALDVPLSCTPDAWCRDVTGALVDVQIKTSRRERRELPEYWRAQVVAECVVQRAEWGVLVLGEQWAVHEQSQGPIRVWPVEPTERERVQVREAAADVMERVRALREEVGHG